MRKEYTGYRFLFFLLVALLVGLTGTGVAFAKTHSPLASSYKAVSATCSGWSIVASPNVGSANNYFNGVATVSASDVWAVGNYVNSSNIAQTLIEHWNGTNWSVVSSPNVGSGANYLFAVAAVSTTDVWAVGYYTNSSNNEQSLIENWNGTSWSVVSSPNLGSANNSLRGVTAVTANDVWAVGYYDNTAKTLIEQWNGTSWSQVHSPNPGLSDEDVLNGVTAVSATDVWAVGTYVNSKGSQPLIENWNGTSWRIASNVGGILQAVTAVSASDVWTVGYFQPKPYFPQTLTKNWNGTRWNVVSSPNVGSDYNYLYGVAAVSASDVWAVGYTGSGDTLIEQWNGTNWSVVTSPNAGSGDSLQAVAAASANNVWAVGGYNSQGSSKTLIEYYC